MVEGLVYKKTENLDTIWQDAKTACGTRTVYNLLLAYEFDISVTSSQFVMNHKGKAEEWQAEHKPPNLLFSHGQYFRGKKGIQHVIDELKTKSASRRALLSLIAMDDILDTGDKAIPSFMVAQFGIGDVLYVTEYFRAIEVTGFLPINLTEMSLLVREISHNVAVPKTIRLLIVAFQAYCAPEFNCLEKAPLDVEDVTVIGVEVGKRNVRQMLGWLEGKRPYESEVLTDGLEALLKAVERYPEEYSPLFRSSLSKAVHSLQEVKKLRAACSDESRIDSEYRKYSEHLEGAIRELGGAGDGA